MGHKSDDRSLNKSSVVDGRNTLLAWLRVPSVLTRGKYGPFIALAGSGEHTSKHSNYIRGEEFLYNLSKDQLLR
jgi:hypothetical protein